MSTQFETNRNLAALKNLKWLLLLRGFLIIGECIILVSAIYVANFPIHADPIWTLISLSIIATSLTWYRLHVDYPVYERELFLHILFDVALFASLLYFAGGGTNPLIWFFILPLIVTATILPQIYTWLMVAVTSAFYMLLIGYHVPLPSLPEPVRRTDIPASVLALQSDIILDLRTFTLWFGYVLIAGAVAYFVVEMTNTLRERERKLARVREDALRDERVVALGTLAAGAAHEMGTPLGTIAILTHELQQEYAPERFKDLSSRLSIMREQVERCKQALSVLSASAGELRAESGRIMTVGAYVREVVHQWQTQQPRIALQFEASGVQPEPSIIADRTLTHALINILNNAVDVSPDDIQFRAYWNESTLSLKILDRGPGIDPHIIANAGQQTGSTKEHGLGVGLFLAKATITRLDGTLNFSNREGGGTVIRISFPLLPATNGENHGE